MFIIVTHDTIDEDGNLGCPKAINVDHIIYIEPRSEGRATLMTTSTYQSGRVIPIQEKYEDVIEAIKDHLILLVAETVREVKPYRQETCVITQEHDQPT